MADTAEQPHNGLAPPNKTAGAEGGGGASSSSSSSVVAGPPKRDFGSTHRVKKLLETYIGTAGHTLTGPANSSLEDPPYKRGATMVHPRSPSPPPSRAAYKLPPDVELSKTVDDDHDRESGGGGVDDGGPHKRRLLVPPHDRYYSSDKMTNGSGGDEAHPHKMLPNGRVTLSRFVHVQQTALTASRLFEVGSLTLLISFPLPPHM